MRKCARTFPLIHFHDPQIAENQKYKCIANAKLQEKR